MQGRASDQPARKRPCTDEQLAAKLAATIAIAAHVSGATGKSFAVGDAVWLKSRDGGAAPGKVEALDDSGMPTQYTVRLEGGDNIVQANASALELRARAPTAAEPAPAPAPLSEGDAVWYHASNGDRAPARIILVDTSVTPPQYEVQLLDAPDGSRFTEGSRLSPRSESSSGPTSHPVGLDDDDDAMDWEHASSDAHEQSISQTEQQRTPSPAPEPTTDSQQSPPHARDRPDAGTQDTVHSTSTSPSHQSSPCSPQRRSPVHNALESSPTQQDSPRASGSSCQHRHGEASSRRGFAASGPAPEPCVEPHCCEEPCHSGSMPQGRTMADRLQRVDKLFEDVLDSASAACSSLAAQALQDLIAVCLCHSLAPACQ